MDGGFAENMFSGAFALVDRCNNSREQADMVPAALAQARYVVFVQLQPLVAAGPAESGQAASEAATASPATPATAETTAASAAAAGPPAATERLLWLPASSSWLQSLLSRPQVQPVLLGRLRPDAQLKADASTPHREEAQDWSLRPGDWLAAIDIDTIEGTNAPEFVKGTTDMRAFCMRHAESWTAAILAQARSLLEFIRRHRFCGSCGKPTTVTKGGIELKCEDQAVCKTSWFPRSDPVVIMLIVDPASDRALLGRQAAWPKGRLSALAGFMEHGEAVEEAVRREVVEESGVKVGRCRYHSSQPWPWPYSLMLGFIGEALDPKIEIDQNELEAAAWYTREEMRSMLAVATRDTWPHLPPPGSIAHQLCKAFADDHPITHFTR